MESSSTTNPKFPFDYFLSSQEFVGAALNVIITEVGELEEALDLAPTPKASILDEAAIVDVIAVSEWRRCCPNKRMILPRDRWFQNPWAPHHISKGKLWCRCRVVASNKQYGFVESIMSSQ